MDVVEGCRGRVSWTSVVDNYHGRTPVLGLRERTLASNCEAHNLQTADASYNVLSEVLLKDFSFRTNGMCPHEQMLNPLLTGQISDTR